MVSNCFMPIGTGLILTLATRTGSGTWIGCLVPLGFGLGIGLSHGPIAVQTLLPYKDIPMYNLALRWVYIVGTITAALSALGSFMLEWRSVKNEKGPPP
ncbi:hypothetical protein MY4824_006770, partial [Beauveria thailandica]